MISNYLIFFVLVLSGVGLITILYGWLSGKREDGTSEPRLGLFWRPPKAPEDEWKKWENL